MTPRTINRQQAREIDRRAVEEFGMTGLVLMENAGRGVADMLCRLGIDGTVVICCGRGNNGGDGFVVARHLDLRGFAVKVLAWADPLATKPKAAGSEPPKDDAVVNFRILSRGGVPIRMHEDANGLEQELAGAAWVVDALLGTGSRGEPRPPLDAVIERINAQPAPVLAIDLPSGLDCDTGQAANHTIRAAHTCTFVAPKPGFFAPGVDRYTGEVHVLDIGAPRKLVEEILGS
jgi:NAD(P)H-hydrate epimerase